MSVIDRERLYKIALTHFAAEGIDDGTRDRIASDVGEDRTAALDGVDDLFEAAVTWGTGELRRDVAEIEKAPHDAAQRLVLMVRRLGTPSEVERSALFAVVRQLIDGNERVRRVLANPLLEPFVKLQGAVGESQFRGQIAPLPPRFVTTVLLCGIVLPQIIEMSALDSPLQGVHARLDDDADDDPATKPRSALLAASLEAIFHGLLPADADDDPLSRSSPSR